MLYLQQQQQQWQQQHMLLLLLLLLLLLQQQEEQQHALLHVYICMYIFIVAGVALLHRYIYLYLYLHLYLYLYLHLYLYLYIIFIFIYMVVCGVYVQCMHAPIQGEQWNSTTLNRLCYSIGSISGAMSEAVERPFVVEVIRSLLNLCESMRGKGNKAVRYAGLGFRV